MIYSGLWCVCVCVCLRPEHLVYLLQLLHHLFNAELSAVCHLVLHLRQPFTQLSVLLIEDDPRIQSVSNLLFTQ